MNASGKRLGFALLLTAGVIIINVFMVVTGATGNFYDRLRGAAPQHTAQAPPRQRVNSHASGARDRMPVDSAGSLPEHVIKRG